MEAVSLPQPAVTLAVMAFGLYESFDVRVDETDEVDNVKARICRGMRVA